MWSKSSRSKTRFDLTLNGRNVVKERSPNMAVHTAPGRGYNGRQYKYIDIRDLLQGSYAPSWRLEKSRDISPGANLDPLPAPRDVDRINDFLSKSAAPRLQRNHLAVSGSGALGQRLSTTSSAIGGAQHSAGSDFLLTPSGGHESLEEEYRALRDLTRTDPRYVEPSSTEYINFVEPKPLHSHGGGTYGDEYLYMDQQEEDDDDSYYGEDDTFTETVPDHPPDSDIPTDNIQQESSAANPPSSSTAAGSSGGADVLVVGEDFAPSLSPIAETAGPIRGWTVVDGEEKQQGAPEGQLQGKGENSGDMGGVMDPAEG